MKVRLKKEKRQIYFIHLICFDGRRKELKASGVDISFFYCNKWLPLSHPLPAFCVIILAKQKGGLKNKNER